MHGIVQCRLRLVPIVFDSVRDGIWVANSSCRYIRILAGFVRINTIDANGLWSPSFVTAVSVGENV